MYSWSLIVANAVALHAALYGVLVLADLLRLAAVKVLGDDYVLGLRSWCCRSMSALPAGLLYEDVAPSAGSSWPSWLRSCCCSQACQSYVSARLHHVALADHDDGHDVEDHLDIVGWVLERDLVEHVVVGGEFGL